MCRSRAHAGRVLVGERLRAHHPPRHAPAARLQEALGAAARDTLRAHRGTRVSPPRACARRCPDDRRDRHRECGTSGCRDGAHDARRLACSCPGAPRCRALCLGRVAAGILRERGRADTRDRARVYRREGLARQAHGRALALARRLRVRHPQGVWDPGALSGATEQGRIPRAPKDICTYIRLRGIIYPATQRESSKKPVS